jgi:hypothetical protein
MVMKPGLKSSRHGAVPNSQGTETVPELAGEDARASISLSEMHLPTPQKTQENCHFLLARVE